MIADPIIINYNTERFPFRQLLTDIANRITRNNDCGTIENIEDIHQKMSPELIHSFRNTMYDFFEPIISKSCIMNLQVKSLVKTRISIEFKIRHQLACTAQIT